MNSLSSKPSISCCSGMIMSMGMRIGARTIDRHCKAFPSSRMNLSNMRLWSSSKLHWFDVLSPSNANNSNRNLSSSSNSQNPARKTPGLQLGLPKRDKGQTMTRASAKVIYLIRDEDLANVKPANRGGEGTGSPVVYNVADLERACIKHWGSEKEFRREQIRREIQRRRKELRQRNLQAVIDSRSHTLPSLYGFDRLAALISGRSALGSLADPILPHRPPETFEDLPWDPALGRPPEPEDAQPLGARAVHTAIVTNAVVAASKLGAFVVTGSASILSEAVHSIADLGNQARPPAPRLAHTGRPIRGRRKHAWPCPPGGGGGGGGL